ncbi:hypothetical protein E2C01_046052 [Portunus trituberculatus]|uniref:Uncharacterized protein n=1 Tax=Portunus trituberculatus TaxID=210409 RepID=A0A5B7FWS7_PORTR|nr:hypothetical protein [Portunus trituberculatus]
MLLILHVCYTPTVKTAPSTLQRQLSLDTITSVRASHHLYTDESLRPYWMAGSAVFSLDTDLPTGGWVGRKLLNSSSSSFCELYGVLDGKVHAAALLDTSHSRDQQRLASVSIHHYDVFCHHRYKYRHWGHMIKRHNVVSARL